MYLPSKCMQKMGQFDHAAIFRQGRCWINGSFHNGSGSRSSIHTSSELQQRFNIPSIPSISFFFSQALWRFVKHVALIASQAPSPSFPIHPREMCCQRNSMAATTQTYSKLSPLRHCGSRSSPAEGYQCLASSLPQRSPTHLKNIPPIRSCFFPSLSPSHSSSPRPFPSPPFTLLSSVMNIKRGQCKPTT